MTSKNTSALKPQQALEEYLSALLTPGADEESVPEVAPVTGVKAAPAETLVSSPVAEPVLDERRKESLQRALLTPLQRQSLELKQAEAAPAVEPAETLPAAADQLPEAAPVPSVSEEASVNKSADDGWLENGRPYWAQERFECLLFNVAGLKLAVPLVCLGGIHAIKERDKITPLPGMPDWLVGIMPTAQGNLRVVDTARWVMPEREIADYAQRMQYVIRINDSEWGLSCDNVDRSFTLMPDQVRWRTSRSKRPWLAGTLIEHMCALLDVDACMRLLEESDRRNRRR